VKKASLNLIERTRQKLDLTDQHAVEVFFADEKPDNVAADWCGNRADKKRTSNNKFI